MAERSQEPPDVTVRDAAIAARDRIRQIAIHAAMILGAILVGVLPALWINHHRRQAAQMAEGSAVSPPEVTVEPIESGAAPPPPAPTVAAPAVVAPPQPTVTPPEPDVTKPADKPKRARPRKQAPPCDVYLHPHGCPH